MCLGVDQPAPIGTASVLFVVSLSQVFFLKFVVFDWGGPIERSGTNKTLCCYGPLKIYTVICICIPCSIVQVCLKNSLNTFKP